MAIALAAALTAAVIAVASAANAVRAVSNPKDT
jgi:hypothetical protein